MTTYQLQVLVETDAGEYHAFQCERYKASSLRHSLMAQAHEQLVKDKLIELVGDEYMLTQLGKDALDDANQAVRRAIIREATW